MRRSGSDRRCGCTTGQLIRQWAGESGHEEAAINPEQCGCGLDVPTDVDPEKVVRLLVDALTSEWS